jgi:hypothetical protein
MIRCPASQPRKPLKHGGEGGDEVKREEEPPNKHFLSTSRRKMSLGKVLYFVFP